jgi:hypothetical protein
MKMHSTSIEMDGVRMFEWPKGTRWTVEKQVFTGGVVNNTFGT